MAIASIETNMQMQIWQFSKEFIDKEIDNMGLVDRIKDHELE